MASGRRVGQRPDCHTFLCKFWHFQMAVSQWKLVWLTPNLGILWISVSSFWLCESIVANPIIYRLVPRPSRFETRQWYLKRYQLKEPIILICVFVKIPTNQSPRVRSWPLRPHESDIQVQGNQRFFFLAASRLAFAALRLWFSHLTRLLS